MKSSNRLTQLLLTILSFTMIGCSGGGLSCPFNIPSCCYDALFGCGTFDLPSGCSCSDYGFLSRASARKEIVAQQNDPVLKRHLRSLSVNQKATNLSGAWSGVFNKQSSTCAGIVKQVNGVVSVKDINNKVSITVPGFGTVSGRKISNRSNVSGSYRVPFTSCKASVAVRMQQVGSGIVTASSSMTYSCGAAVQCQAVFSGTLQRNS